MMTLEVAWHSSTYRYMCIGLEKKFQNMVGATPRGKKLESDKTDLGQERRCIYLFVSVFQGNLGP